MADAYRVFAAMPHRLRFAINKIRIDVTVRGVDHEGKFSRFPGKFCMLISW